MLTLNNTLTILQIKICFLSYDKYFLRITKGLNIVQIFSLSSLDLTFQHQSTFLTTTCTKNPLIHLCKYTTKIEPLFLDKTFCPRQKLKPHLEHILAFLLPRIHPFPISEQRRRILIHLFHNWAYQQIIFTFGRQNHTEALTNHTIVSPSWTGKITQCEDLYRGNLNEKLKTVL